MKTPFECAGELRAEVEMAGQPLSTGMRSCGQTPRETRLDFGAYVQTERVRASGVEQLWHFDAQPTGTGDVEIRVPIGERLIATGAAGLMLASADDTATFYGHGTWIDATGQRTRVAANWRDGHVELILSRSLLNNTRYPAVLDPVVGELHPVDEPVFRRGEATRFGSLTGNGEDVWVRTDSQTWRFVAGARSEPLGASFGRCMSPRRCLQGNQVVDPYDPTYVGGEVPAGATVYPIRDGAIAMYVTATAWTVESYDADLNLLGAPRVVLSGTALNYPNSIGCADDRCVFGDSTDFVEVTVDAHRTAPFAAPSGRGTEGFWTFARGSYGYITKDFARTTEVLAEGLGARWDESGHALLITGVETPGFVILPDLREVPVDAGVNDALYIEARDELWLAYTELNNHREVRRVDTTTGATIESDYFYDDSDSHLASSATKTGAPVVVWLDALPDGSGRFVAGFLNAEGAVEARVELATSESAAVPNQLFVAPTATGRWLASWGEFSIVFDRSGTMTAEPARRGVDALAVATEDGGAFWEVFGDEGMLAVRSFNETGAPLSAPLPLPLSMEGEAAIAPGPDGFLVAASVAGVRGRDISVVRLDSAGELQDAVPLPVSAGDLDQTAPVVVDDGRGWMVYWHDARGGIYGARVAYDGSRPELDGTLLCADGSNEYDAMFDGSDVWIVYSVDEDLFARRFRETTSAGDAISLSSGVDIGAVSMGRAEENVTIAVALNVAAPDRYHTHSLLIDNDANGSVCTTDAECTSGLCTDEGVCCDTRCDSVCETCRVVRGATDDGVCGLASVGSECRASTNACDPAEFCTGTEVTCPAELPPPMSCFDGGVDAGSMDGGMADAAGPDAGVTDVGVQDAGSEAGVVDASAVDSGEGGGDEGGCSITHRNSPPQGLGLVLFAFWFLRRRGSRANGE